MKSVAPVKLYSDKLSFGYDDIDTLFLELRRNFLWQR